MQLAVERQHQVAAVMRFAHGGDVFDDAAQAVLDHAAAAGDAGQSLLHAQFHAVLPGVFHIGEADHVGHDLALRIETLVLLAGLDAGDAQLQHLVHGFLLDLALEIDEITVRVELLAQLRFRHFQQAGQRAQFFRRRFQHVIGYGPYRLDRHGGSEHFAIAVGDPATRCRQLQRAGVTRFTLLLQEIGGQALQPQGTAGQRQECREHHEQHQARTPWRQLHGKQRTGRKGNAACSGAARVRAGSGAHYLTSPVMYCVRAGVSGTMLRSRRALDSMRACLPSVD